LAWKDDALCCDSTLRDFGGRRFKEEDLLVFLSWSLELSPDSDPSCFCLIYEPRRLFDDLPAIPSSALSFGDLRSLPLWLDCGPQFFVGVLERFCFFSLLRLDGRMTPSWSGVSPQDNSPGILSSAEIPRVFLHDAFDEFFGRPSGLVDSVSPVVETFEWSKYALNSSAMLLELKMCNKSFLISSDDSLFSNKLTACATSSKKHSFSILRRFALTVQR
jgi:hypothetical protein